MQKLLEIGKIVRTHGIKGAVKVISYLDGVNFSIFKHIFIGEKLLEANIVHVVKLNNDAFSIKIDIINSIDEAEKFRNKSIYIDRTEYKEFKDKVYLNDLIGKPVLDENHEKIGELIDFDDYGASVILQIKTGVVTYSLPFVEDIITYDENIDAFLTTNQKFEDLRV